MAEVKVPRAPSGLGRSGKQLWTDTVVVFAFPAHELEVLESACRTLDLIDALQAAIDEHGPLVDSPQGLKAHPAVVEIRQQRLVYARLVSALRLPEAPGKGKGKRPPEPMGDDGVRRPQHRTGVRGLYSVGEA